MLPAAVAATHNMSREEALSVLRKYATAREPILVAVYEYWKNKRERWGKPFMRRLQVRPCMGGGSCLSKPRCLGTGCVGARDTVGGSSASTAKCMGARRDVALHAARNLKFD